MPHTSLSPLPLASFRLPRPKLIGASAFSKESIPLIETNGMIYFANTTAAAATTTNSRTLSRQRVGVIRLKWSGGGGRRLVELVVVVAQTGQLV